ncbi:aminotransferase class V-fold PLP-dependent enzyme [Portibacter lacus]|uniref:Aminotransferase n=1 Tax=Portibacter lacus TaxID=1099794 RepID=A0AA37SMA1_9BACT|nr:aminotransferase class V-fold PLP-dependent enzyme [Portibacter lacus]GLR15964.1 aminotransferase [Portibacter lacus]
MLECKKDLFLIDEHVHYLNNSYMSPNLKSVEMAGVIAVRSMSKPYLIDPSSFFKPLEDLKKSFAQVINLKNHERIAIAPSASYGLANVASNLNINGKKNIVIPEGQFPSNYYSWDRVAKEHNLEIRIVSPQESIENRGQLWNEAIIDAIDKDTLLLACGHVHWADGTKFDLRAFRKACDEHDALLIVDGSQSIGALPFDIEEIKPDALVCVGYKWLFGPYGIGFSYYSERFDQGKPIEENWANRKNSEDFKNLVNYQSEYKPYANRYMAGESSNFINVPMMQTALQQINAWEVQNIQDYSENLISSYLDAFRSIGCRIEDAEFRCNHLLGIKLPGHIDIDAIGKSLKANHVYVSIRGNAIRVATSTYNSKTDMDKLWSVLYENHMV